MHNGFQLCSRMDTLTSGTRIKRIYESLQRCQILHIVLSLVECLCNGDVELFAASKRVEHSLARLG